LLLVAISCPDSILPLFVGLLVDAGVLCVFSFSVAAIVLIVVIIPSIVAMIGLSTEIVVTVHVFATFCHILYNGMNWFGMIRLARNMIFRGLRLHRLTMMLDLLCDRTRRRSALFGYVVTI
jgi:hypothetical protein